MRLEMTLVLVWSVCVVGASALLHELGHAWAARVVGWRVVGFRWHWYGVACVADTCGRPERLWKVALGGLWATALLALAFGTGAMLPEPASALFGFGFALNAVLLFTNLVPVRALDGGQIVAGLKAERAQRGTR